MPAGKVGTVIDDIYEARAQVARALAHPVRLQIVDVLAREGELTVSELTELVGAGQPSVSRHLRTLVGVGLLQSEKRGLHVAYRLLAPCAAELFRCLDTILMQDLERRRNRLIGGGDRDEQ